MKLNKLHIFLGALALLLIFLYLPVPRMDLSAVKKSPEKNFPAPKIEAKSALAEDLLTGEVLFSKNSGEVLPLASVTKIITLLTVLDYASPDEEVTVSRQAVLTPEPSSLRIGEHFLARDLVAMAMAESSNDATAALYEYIVEKNQIVQEKPASAEATAGKQKEWFLDLMQKKAERLGAANMKFYNIWGLDESLELSGGYGSADDLLKIAKASLGSPLWQSGAVSEVISQEGIKHKLKFTNELGPELTPLLGSKTGYTDLAGGNLLVIVEYPLGHPLGIVVLGSSEKGRFEDVKTILIWIKATKPL
ncbi:MAG: serine hydrolase [bacterium]|nr:serine hydrolase [bacterium]